MIELVLYSKPDCHLCEEARELLGMTLTGKPVAVEIVDISGDAGLQERYGLRIPVVARKDDERECGWPFGPADILELLR
jgi:hypothetical protein